MLKRPTSVQKLSKLTELSKTGAFDFTLYSAWDKGKRVWAVKNFNFVIVFNLA